MALSAAVIPIRKHTRELAAPPQIITRGVIYKDQSDASLSEAEAVLLEAVQRSKKSKNALKSAAIEALSRYFYKNIRRNPLIEPVIIEVG